MIPPALIKLVTDQPFTSVADIGAATGKDALLYAAMGPDVQVYAFEPVPQNVEYLRRAVAANKDTADRVHVYPVALGDENGVAAFYRSTGTPYPNAADDVVDGDKNWRLSSSLLAPKDHREVHPWCGFREEFVPVMTMRAWADIHAVTEIEFVHMDVQGAELDVLNGAGEALMGTFKGVWLEVSTREMYKGQPLVEDVAVYMQAHGFKLAYEHLKPVGAQGDQLWVRA